MKDASAETFMEAIGFAVYSNRKNTVQSFKSVFELLWNERTLNEEVERELIKCKRSLSMLQAMKRRTPAPKVKSSVIAQTTINPSSKSII